MSSVSEVSSKVSLAATPQVGAEIPPFPWILVNSGCSFPTEHAARLGPCCVNMNAQWVGENKQYSHFYWSHAYTLH